MTGSSKSAAVCLLIHRSSRSQKAETAKRFSTRDRFCDALL